jgi:hypothetical protein
VSLPGVERGDVGRGEDARRSRCVSGSFRLDVVLDELVPIAENARVHVHHGTADLTARVVRVGDRFAQLRLDRPVVARPAATGVVLRRETTLGAVPVLDPVARSPPRRDTTRVARRG